MSESVRSREHAGAVGIGCGSLIIIALIVFFLGRADVQPLETKVDALAQEVRQLRLQIESRPAVLPVNPVVDGPGD